MVKVFVINGAGTSGKDTFIDLFTEVCRNYERCRYYVFKFSSVDKVKHFAKLIGWDGVKDDKGRKFLSDIKDAMTIYNDAPFLYMKDCITRVVNNTENAFVFFHVREPSEIQKMVDNFGAITIFIDRPSVSEDSFTNHADKNVRDFQYDFYITNDGTLEDLKNKAEDIFYKLK